MFKYLKKNKMARYEFLTIALIMALSIHQGDLKLCIQKETKRENGKYE